MGEVVKQDKPLTVKVLLKALDILDREFHMAPTARDRKRVIDMGTWLISGFCLGLRGEEMLLIKNNGTLGSMINLKNNDVPYYKLFIKGRTKGSQTGVSSFEIPIAGVTEGLGINNGVWIMRMKNVKAELGICGGRLFIRNLKIPKLLEFEEGFNIILEKFQDLGTIDKSISVREEYSIRRSTQRGVTMHAINVGVDEKYINAVNHQRKEKDAVGSVVNSLGMTGVYTKLDELIPYVLRYSRAL